MSASTDVRGAKTTHTVEEWGMFVMGLLALLFGILCAAACLIAMVWGAGVAIVTAVIGIVTSPLTYMVLLSAAGAWCSLRLALDLLKRGR